MNQRTQWSPSKAAKTNKGFVSVLSLMKIVGMKAVTRTWECDVRS